MKKIKKPNKIVWGMGALLLVFCGYTLWGNITVGTTCYDIILGDLPDSFDNFKIAQISDFHNAEYGENNSKIIKILENEKPDIIAITGDFVDVNRTDIGVAINFVEQAMKIAPCYYVPGNHEAWLNTYSELESRLIKAGVVVLRNEMRLFSKGNESIQIIGLDDPDFKYYESRDQYKILDNELKNMNLPEGFKLLLSHRPEIFGAYFSNDIDLVLSGHVHGGQVRLPFIGGVIAPHQGLFPRYDAGVYKESNTTMVISRGVGNSSFPIRINDRPEVVIVRLHRPD